MLIYLYQVSFKKWYPPFITFYQRKLYFLLFLRLNVNKNFNQDVSNATLDIMADDRDEMRKSSQKTMWDRKKKKFVSVQSTMEKTKKFKTESGAYINASYKSNLYSKWLKNSKAGDRYEDQDDGDDGEDKKDKKFFGASNLLKFIKFFNNCIEIN